MKTEREKALKRVGLAAEKMRKKVEAFQGAVATGREAKIERAWTALSVTKDALNEQYVEWVWCECKVGGTNDEL